MADKPKSDADSPKPEHVKSLLDGLKGLLGISDGHTPVMGERNPANAEVLREAGVGDALNRGIAQGTESNE